MNFFRIDMYKYTKLYVLIFKSVKYKFWKNMNVLIVLNCRFSLHYFRWSRDVILFYLKIKFLYVGVNL